MQAVHEPDADFCCHMPGGSGSNAVLSGSVSYIFRIQMTHSSFTRKGENYENISDC